MKEYLIRAAKKRRTFVPRLAFLGNILLRVRNATALLIPHGSSYMILADIEEYAYESHICSDQNDKKINYNQNRIREYGCIYWDNGKWSISWMIYRLNTSKVTLYLIIIASCNCAYSIFRNFLKLFSYFLSL